MKKIVYLKMMLVSSVYILWSLASINKLEVMSKTTYSLSIFKNSEFKADVDFNETDYLKYSDSLLKLMVLKNDENLFKIVELNYIDLMSKIEAITKKMSDGNLYSPEQEHLHLEINRLILNLLSSIRTYLDHTETRLKREYGVDSEEFKIFKTETSSAYDNNFSYRFLYKLRNYSQHCGLPAGSLTTSSSNEKDGTKHVLILSLVRDNLLQQFDWGNPITGELQNQEEKFDILSLINTKYNLLKKINLEIKHLAYKHHKQAGFELLHLLINMKDKEGSPCILKMESIGGKHNLTVKWFPFDSIKKITGVNLDKASQ